MLEGETEPVVVETIFGWTLSGSMVDYNLTHKTNVSLNVMLAVDKVVENEHLHELLKTF